MAVSTGDECLAAVHLVDTLDQPQLLQFLQRPVNGHQSHSGAGCSCPVVNFHRSKGVGRGSDSLNDGFACVGQAVAIFLQAGKAEFGIHLSSDNENHFQKEYKCMPRGRQDSRGDGKAGIYGPEVTGYPCVRQAFSPPAMLVTWS